MEAFGVHFRIDREELLGPLEDLFAQLRAAKEADDFGAPGDWRARLHPDVVPALLRLTQEARAERSELRASRPTLVATPTDAIGGQWDIGDILDAVQNGEYQLLEIVRTGASEGELRIDPEAYPYGGIGAFIGLVEAHGMHVLGFNEYGKYQPRT